MSQSGCRTDGVSLICILTNFAMVVVSPVCTTTPKSAQHYIAEDINEGPTNTKQHQTSIIVLCSLAPTMSNVSLFAHFIHQCSPAEHIFNVEINQSKHESQRN